MPAQIELYLHRVGRTARAGEKGRRVVIFSTSTYQSVLIHIADFTRAISLVGEADRTMLKAVIKRSSRTEGADDSIRHRLVPDDAVKATLARLDEVKDEVSEVLKEEKEEKEVRGRVRALLCFVLIFI